MPLVNPVPRALPPTTRRPASLPRRTLRRVAILIRKVLVTLLWVVVALFAWTCLDVLGLLLVKVFPHNELLAHLSRTVDDIWWGIAGWLQTITPDWITIDPRHVFG